KYLKTLPLLLLAILANPSFSQKECAFTKSTPVASASHHPPLEFQSGYGNDCLKYQLRNGPKGLFMPTKWTHGKTVLFDWNVPDGPCDWIEVVHTSYQRDNGETSFGYGVLKDEFHDKPLAYRPAGKPSCGDDKGPKDEFRPYTTSLKGPVAI